MRRLRPMASLGQELALKGINMPQYFAAQDPVVVVSGLGRATNFDPGRWCALPPAVAGPSPALTVGGKTYDAATMASQIPALSDPRGLLPDGAQALKHRELLPGAVAVRPGRAGERRAGHGWCRRRSRRCRRPAVDRPVPAGWVRRRSVAAAMDSAPTGTGRWWLLRDPALQLGRGRPGPARSTRANWSFTGTDYQWTAPIAAQRGRTSTRSRPGQMTLRGRTFVTPQLAITLANQLDQYANTHAFRDPNLEALLTNLDAYVDSIAGPGHPVAAP